MEYDFPALGRRAFLSRAEFGSHHETVDHVNRQIFRSFKGERLGEVPTELFKLRHDVYCIERAFLNADESFDGMEIDDFDANAMHFAAYTMEEELMGTVRLVTPRALLPFPFQLHCSTFDKFQLPPRAQCGEVSRLAVKRIHRRRRADSVTGVPGFPLPGQTAPPLAPQVEQRHPGSPMLLLGMYREMYRYSCENGIRYWFAAMERSLAHALAKMGFRFTAIGPVADYYGAVTPYMLDLGQLAPRLAESNPPLAAWFDEKRLLFATPRKSHLCIHNANVEAPSDGNGGAGEAVTD